MYAGPTTLSLCPEANTGIRIANSQERNTPQNCRAITDVNATVVPVSIQLTAAAHHSTSDVIARALDDFFVRPFAHGPLIVSDSIATTAERWGPSVDVPSGGIPDGCETPVVLTHAYTQWDPLEPRDPHSWIPAPMHSTDTLCLRGCYPVSPLIYPDVSEWFREEVGCQNLCW